MNLGMFEVDSRLWLAEEAGIISSDTISEVCSFETNLNYSLNL